MNKEALEKDFTILKAKLTCLIDCKLAFDAFVEDGSAEDFTAYLDTEIAAYKNMYKNVQAQLEKQK